MGEAVIAAIITGVLAVIGSIITAVTSSKLTAYKIEELKENFKKLEEKVDRHNNLVERMAIVEQSTKSAHRRLDEIHVGRAN